MPDWTEGKILELITNKIEESLRLDYKRCASLLQKSGKSNRDKEMTELSRDVSSFANAAGGMIIYGVIENEHLPQELDEGFDPQEVSKEWLEDVITSRIDRTVDGVLIHPVRLDLTYPGRYAYVVEIPQSSTIHQAYDKRYYRRRNFKAEPMEDYEIREGLSRSKYPQLEVNYGWEQVKTSQELHEYHLTFTLRNVGSIRARDVMFECDFPQIALASPPRFVEHRMLHTRLEVRSTTVDKVPYTNLRLRITQGRVVFFPTEEMKLEEYGLKIHYKIDNDIHMSHLDLPIRWRLYADDAPPKEGQFPLREIQRF